MIILKNIITSYIKILKENVKYKIQKFVQQNDGISILLKYKQYAGIYYKKSLGFLITG